MAPSCRLASAHVGSLPLSIMTASRTFSTSGGGFPYDLISVMSFLFNASSACITHRHGKLKSNCNNSLDCKYQLTVTSKIKPTVNKAIIDIRFILLY